jgi:hypothetical protein
MRYGGGMTQQEWLSYTNPWDMIDFIGNTANRKLRLFACACCRQAWNGFVPPVVIRAVTAAEAFADGALSADTLARVREWVVEHVAEANREDARAGTGYLSRIFHACLSVCSGAPVAELAQDAAHSAAFAAADVPFREPATGRTRTPPGPDQRPPELAAERALQADLFRDVFGNPFQSSEMQLEWFTVDVLALARGIYADRAFDRMPILADALQDAGCDDEDVLAHCREPREHVRGCWVVDLLLGKR